MVLFVMNAYMCGTVIAAPQRIELKEIIGKVQVRREASSRWRPARPGMRIQQGWGVRTYVESSVKLLFQTGSVVKIGEKSAVTISEAVVDQAGKSSGTSVNMLTGKLWSNVKKLASKKSKFEVETPTAVASIRGTRFGVYATKNKTAVDVHSGNVRVRPRGSDNFVDVGKGKRALVSGQDDIKLYDLKKDDGQLPGPPPEDGLADDTTAADTTQSDTTQPGGDVDTTVTDTTAEDSLSAQADTAEADIDTAAMPDTTTTDTSLSDTAGDAPDAVADTTMAVDTADRGTPVPDTTASLTPDTSATSGDMVLTLSLSTPADGATITTPAISVSGKTSPGAEVKANGISVPVQSGGEFSTRVPIPDEEQEYTVTVKATLGDQQKQIERRVIYETVQEALSLTIQSPGDGAQIMKSSLAIQGKAQGAQEVMVNGFKAGVSSSGYFSYQIPLTEQDIGEYPLRVVASNEEEEIEKEIMVEVAVTSPQINTSAPRIQVLNATTNATKQSELRVNVMDRTPGDLITLSAENNGSTDEYELEPGATQGIYLEEGKNRYTIRASDRAANQANVVSGEVFYLPGPLQMTVIEPQRRRMVIDDLPPMPSDQISKRLTIEVEIDDGINDVPGTIKYCRISGTGVNQLCREIGNYHYQATVQLSHGLNSYTILAEDIAGNQVRRTVEVDIR